MTKTLLDCRVVCKVFAVVACVALLSLSPTFGQQLDAERIKAAEQLVDLGETEQAMFDALDGVLDQQVEQFAQMGLSPEGITELKTAMSDFFRKVIQWDVVKPEIVQLYAVNFTTDELKQLADFYRTPLGRKTMDVMPKITAEGMAIGQRMVEKHQHELQAILIPLFQKYLSGQ